MHSSWIFSCRSIDFATKRLENLSLNDYTIEMVQETIDFQNYIISTIQWIKHYQPLITFLNEANDSLHIFVNYESYSTRNERLGLKSSSFPSVVLTKHICRRLYERQCVMQKW